MLDQVIKLRYKGFFNSIGFQGQLSFSDNNFLSNTETCVIVVTNPIEVRFAIEDQHLLTTKESTHLRVLVFAEKQILKVTVTIDDKKVNIALFSCVHPIICY